MSLTAFAVKSLSPRSDIRFRASCTEADDGVERTTSEHCVCAHSVGEEHISRKCSELRVRWQCNYIPGHAVFDQVSSEANCEDPDRRMQTLVSNRDLWSFDILSVARRLSRVQLKSTLTGLKMVGTRYH